MEEIQYQISNDANGNPLEGGKYYTLHLPPDIPARNFWSIIVYDNHTRLMIRTDQPWPSVHRQRKDFMINHDGSADVWFGPKAPDGKENNWVQTIPAKGWNLIFRLYGPFEPCFNRTWRPGEVEEVKSIGSLVPAAQETVLGKYHKMPVDLELGSDDHVPHC